MNEPKKCGHGEAEQHLCGARRGPYACRLPRGHSSLHQHIAVSPAGTHTVTRWGKMTAEEIRQQYGKQGMEALKKAKKRCGLKPPLPLESSTVHIPPPGFDGEPIYPYGSTKPLANASPESEGKRNNLGEPCGSLHPSLSLACSLKAGHPGRHKRLDPDGCVVEVWPQKPSSGQDCGAMVTTPDGEQYICTELKGHPGEHEAHDTNNGPYCEWLQGEGTLHWEWLSDATPSRWRGTKRLCGYLGPYLGSYYCELPVGHSGFHRVTGDFPNGMLEWPTRNDPVLAPKEATRARKLLHNIEVCGAKSVGGDFTCHLTDGHSGRHFGHCGNNWSMTLTWSDQDFEVACDATKVTDDGVFICTQPEGHGGPHQGHLRTDPKHEKLWPQECGAQMTIHTCSRPKGHEGPHGDDKRCWPQKCGYPSLFGTYHCDLSAGHGDLHRAANGKLEWVTRESDNKIILSAKPDAASRDEERTTLKKELEDAARTGSERLRGLVETAVTKTQLEDMEDLNRQRTGLEPLYRRPSVDRLTGRIAAALSYCGSGTRNPVVDRDLIKVLELVVDTLDNKVSIYPGGSRHGMLAVELGKLKRAQKKGED